MKDDLVETIWKKTAKYSCAGMYIFVAPDALPVSATFVHV